MNIPIDNYPVPSNPGQNQIVPHTPIAPRVLPPANDPISRRRALLPQPFSNKTDIQPAGPKTAYSSDLRLVKSKMNQVGLLIDIYA